MAPKIFDKLRLLNPDGWVSSLSSIFFSFPQDLLISLSQILKGSNHEKLKFAFKMYDTNADGCITKGELTDIVSSVHELMGRSAHHNRHVSWKNVREVRDQRGCSLASCLDVVRGIASLFLSVLI